MGALQNVIVCREHLTGLQAGFGFGFVKVEHPAQTVHIGEFEGVFAELLLAVQEYVAVFQGLVPLDVLEIAHALQGHGDAFQPVGEFHRHRVEGDAADLLEVGELGDFQPVQPDLPAQPPGGDGRLCPVVLHKADVVLAGVNAEGFQRAEVKFLGVAPVGFDDDLILGVLVNAVGVLAVTPVVGADGGFHVGHVPGFGAEGAQKSGRVHRPRADFGVIGLPDQASLFVPVGLQFEDDGLEVEGHGGWGLVVDKLVVGKLGLVNWGLVIGWLVGGLYREAGDAGDRGARGGRQTV